MIIDGHAHACGIYQTEECILENLQRQGIDKVILSAGEYESSTNYGIPHLEKFFKTSKLMYASNKLIYFMTKRTNAVAYLDSENERVAKLAEKYPDQIGNTYWVNCNDKECVKKLEVFSKRYSMSMIKMHQCWTPFDIQDERCKIIIEKAKQLHKPVFIHLINQEQVKKFIQVAEEFCENTFIVAHLIGIEEFTPELKNSNIYFDLSCPELHSMEMLKRAYELFGANKLLMGSDTPYGKNNIHKVLKQIEQLKLTQEEKEMITYKNIQALIK